MADQSVLAPVPADLLQDALDEGFSRVAFGSMNWDFFRTLGDDCAGERVPVLLYASHDTEIALEAKWAAEFVEWRDASKAERDPEFVEQLRSPLARHDWSGSGGGGWAVYWIVENLRRLDEPIRLGSLRLPSGRRLSPAFIPRGPIRVQALPDNRGNED